MAARSSPACPGQPRHRRVERRRFGWRRRCRRPPASPRCPRTSRVAFRSSPAPAARRSKQSWGLPSSYMKDRQQCSLLPADAGSHGQSWTSSGLQNLHQRLSIMCVHHGAGLGNLDIEHHLRPALPAGAPPASGRSRPGGAPAAAGPGRSNPRAAHTWSPAPAPGLSDWLSLLVHAQDAGDLSCALAAERQS